MSTLTDDFGNICESMSDMETVAASEPAGTTAEIVSVQGGKFHRPDSTLFNGGSNDFRNARLMRCGRSLVPLNFFETVADADAYTGGRLQNHICQQCEKKISHLWRVPEVLKTSEDAAAPEPEDTCEARDYKCCEQMRPEDHQVSFGYFPAGYVAPEPVGERARKSMESQQRRDLIATILRNSAHANLSIATCQLLANAIHAAVVAPLEPKINNHQALVDALKGVAIMLNTELRDYDSEPWAQRVRAALAAVEGTAKP